MQNDQLRRSVTVPAFCILPFALCILIFAPGCARRLLDLPAGAGAPLPDFAAVHGTISERCAGVRTLTAELGLSGRAGGDRMRGRALAGFQVPDAMRLEGLAPFGAPAFILVARGRDATLLLPRDARVLRRASAGEILGALTGVSLAPADLQAILTGCIVPEPMPVRGAQHGDDWRSIALQGGATIFLRRAGTAWQLRAAHRDGWRIEYSAWQGGFPRVVRFVSTPPSPPAPARLTERPSVDLTVQISQIEANAAIDPAAFTVDVPDEALPMTLDDLRASGPLRSETAR